MAEDAGFDFVADIPQEKLATEGKSARHKREVCIYWLENRCMKDEECEFLHAHDLEKMPECPRGKLCMDKTCKFKHTPDSAKEECINYKLGFCSLGLKCRYRHATMPPEALPPISELWLRTYTAEERARKKEADRAGSWRVAMCDNLVKNGWCEYFDMCSYAHGEEQIRRFGRKRGRDAPYAGVNAEPLKRGRGPMGGGAPPPYAPPQAAAPPADALTSLLRERESGSALARALPDQFPHCLYFIVRTLSPEALALSLKRGEWICSSRYREQIEIAVRETPHIFVFFSIVDSQYFQGVARVRGMPRPAPEAGDARISVPVEWLRTCALAFSDTKGLRNPLTNLDFVARSSEWQMVSPPVGKALMLLSFRAAEVEVDVASIDDSGTFEVFDPSSPEHAQRLVNEDFGEEFAREPRPMAPAPYSMPPAPAAAMRGPAPSYHEPAPTGPMGRAPPAPHPRVDDHAYQGPPAPMPAAAPAAASPDATSMLNLEDVDPGEPTSPLVAALLAGRIPDELRHQRPAAIAAEAFMRGQPGFLFACNNVTLDVVLRCGIFGAPDEMENTLKNNLFPGTPTVLLNVHNRELHGLFLARAPPVRDLIPNLFPRMGSARKTFPWHTQVMCVLKAAPLSNDEFAPMVGQKPVPGPVAPQGIYAVAYDLFSRIPPERALHIAGLLRQMEETGMPTVGLLAEPVGVTIEDDGTGGASGAAAEPRAAE